MKTLTTFLTLACLLGCAKTAVTPDCVAKANSNCACTQVYDPVCGCNGITYGNACEATCVGISYTKGACVGK